MAYKISGNDGPIIDAFGRIRVSNPITQFNSKQLWVKDTNNWDEATTGAGAAAAKVANQPVINLSVTASTVGSVVRQTRRRFNYQPGKSQLLFLTANVDGVSPGTTKRLGQFDQNNGLFFEFTDAAYVGVRTNTSGSPVDTLVSQSNWNVDKMDGSGHSRITVDWTKAQIFVIDYEWLGVGRVRFGMVINGLVYYVHEVLNANQHTTVYMASPNLPIRYEIINSADGDSATLKQICSTLITEGGLDPTGSLRSIASPVGGTSHNSSNVDALFGIRLASDRLDAAVKLISFFCLGEAANDLGKVQLLLNPTIAGAVPWDTTTHDDVDVFAGVPGTNTVSGGTVLFSAPVGSRVGDVSDFPPPGIVLTSQISGTADVIVLALSIPANGTFFAALNWLSFD